MPVPKATSTARKPASTTKSVPAAKTKPSTKAVPVAKVAASKGPAVKAPTALKRAEKKPAASTKQPPAPKSSSKTTYGSCCSGSPTKKETTAKKRSSIKKKSSYPTGMCYFSDTNSGSDSSFDICPLLPSQMRMLIGKKIPPKTTAAKKSVSVGETYYYSDTYSDDYDCDAGSCSMSEKK